MLRFWVRAVVLTLAIFGASTTFAGDQIVAATILTTLTLMGLAVAVKSVSRSPGSGAMSVSAGSPTPPGRVRDFAT